MTPNLPSQYLFFLQSCYEKDFTHPICKNGTQKENVWYLQGLQRSYLILTPDPTRPYGNKQCNKCSGFCSGHYMKSDQLISHVNSGGKTSVCKPPFQLIHEC